MNTYSHMVEYNNNNKRLINKIEQVRSSRDAQARQTPEKKNVLTQLLTSLTH